MPEPVVISGYGILSALGLNAGENLRALQVGQTGIANADHLKTRHVTLPVGEVKASNTLLAEMAGMKPTYSRTVLLAVLAAREAVANAGLSSDYRQSMGLVSGTSVGGMDVSENAYKQWLNGENLDVKTAFGGHDCGHSTQTLAKQLGIEGYRSTISTACSSSANAIMLGARLIRSGQLNCVLVGGTDALSLFTLNGFNALKIVDPEWCKPFDQKRNGLNLGEGAAYLVLESESHLKKRNGKALAEVIGYGNANDAFHQTASSPEGIGAYSAMQQALAVAEISADAVDYINAHGTGTANNDQSESLAIQKVMKDHATPFSSTKAFTGHTLGAAGGIEAVFSVMALEQQHIWPSLNVHEPMTVLPAPVSHTQQAKLTTVMSNSLGFGGNCSTLIFRKG